MLVIHYSLYVTIFLCFGEFQIAPIEVRIGKGLRPFPPSKRSGRVSPHCAFQYSDQHPQVSLGVGRRMRFPSRAHQLEHSTTRCMGSPALPGNKAPLLFPSFAFSGKSLSSRFMFLSLADLHHVPAITVEHWADLAASALSTTRWHFRVPLRGKVV